jgi:hypothetical protein
MASKQGPGRGDGDTAERIAEVEADVERLFGTYITADPQVRGEGFEMEGGFGDGGYVLGAAETGQFTFVRWRWRGHHTGRVGRFDGETFDRRDPEFLMARGTGNAVTVEGLTILEERDDGIYPRRFVDWLSVYSQMGIIAPARPIGRASTELRDPPDPSTLKPPVDPRDGLDEDRPAKTAAGQ